MDMQQRMQDQTRGMFTAFPFPNFATPQTGGDDDKKAPAAGDDDDERVEHVDLSDDDNEMLDAVWDEIAKRKQE
jgi:hypothetical protein